MNSSFQLAPVRSRRIPLFGCTVGPASRSSGLLAADAKEHWARGPQVIITNNPPMPCRPFPFIPAPMDTSASGLNRVEQTAVFRTVLGFLPSEFLKPQPRIKHGVYR